MPDKIAVEAMELTKKFGAFTAVDRVSFQVPEGEIFGFLGPNGAGKTTVIRMLCGLLMPTSGTGRVAGFDIRTQPERVKEHIGYMSQRFSLYQDLTVRENLDFYASIYQVPPQEKPQRIAELIAMANLTGWERELAANLSGGWKQRLALGCAIVHKPPILFLDEPTAGVDPTSRRHFWDMIYTLAGQGTTVFVTTHYMDEAEHCNTVGLMHASKLIALGTPDELKRLRWAEEELLEVECSSPIEAVDVVARVPGVRDAALYGVLLHVGVDSAESAAPRLTAALGERGIAVQRIERIIPSLEDVFVSLIAEQGQDGRQA